VRRLVPSPIRATSMPAISMPKFYFFLKNAQVSGSPSALAS
jgi:hypothetical protein